MVTYFHLDHITEMLNTAISNPDIDQTEKKKLLTDVRRVTEIKKSIRDLEIMESFYAVRPLIV